MLVNVGFGTWSRRYYSVLEYPQKSIYHLVVIYCIFAIIGSLSSGKISRLLKLNHKQSLLFFLPVLSICYFVFTFCVDISIIYMIMPFLGFFSYFPSTHYTSFAIELSPKQYVASASSMQNLVLQSGGLIMGPFTTTVLLFGPYSFVWFSYSLILILSFFLVMMVRK